jgi:UDPglucose--hexose-1-phosphate uridylyltransferase
MPQLRLDETTSDWVIFAPSRVRRPNELRSHAVPAAESTDATKSCPFCPGNEAWTPPEIFAERPPGGSLSDWQIRVVPNKFPALTIEADKRRHDDSQGFRVMGGCGAHEVVIESRDHFRPLAEQSVDQIERVLRTVQMRSQDLMRDKRFENIVVFKNHGEAAGTSLRHPHWQIIATPVVPKLLRQKQLVATDYFDQTGNCLYCGMLQRELAAKTRVVETNDDFAAVLPFASHVPFETWILPRHHISSFASEEPRRWRALAELLKRVLLRLHRGLENPEFNLTVDSDSRGEDGNESFLWHIRVLPRLTTPAGFELGSGMSINTVLPEEAATYLRSVEI